MIREILLKLMMTAIIVTLAPFAFLWSLWMVWFGHD